MLNPWLAERFVAAVVQLKFPEPSVASTFPEDAPSPNGKT